MGCQHTVGGGCLLIPRQDLISLCRRIPFRLLYLRLTGIRRNIQKISIIGHPYTMIPGQICHIPKKSLPQIDPDKKGNAGCRSCHRCNSLTKVLNPGPARRDYHAQHNKGNPQNQTKPQLRRAVVLILSCYICRRFDSINIHIDNAISTESIDKIICGPEYQHKYSWQEKCESQPSCQWHDDEIHPHQEHDVFDTIF